MQFLSSHEYFSVSEWHPFQTSSNLRGPTVDVLRTFGCTWFRVWEKDVTCVPLPLPRLLPADKIPVTGFNQDKVKVVFYRALYPFDARSHDEITITPGDIVMVRGKLSITPAKHHLCVCYGGLCKVISLYEPGSVWLSVEVNRLWFFNGDYYYWRIQTSRYRLIGQF